MSGISVSHGEELDLMAHLDKQSRSSTAFDVAVIRMGANHHYLQGLVLGKDEEGVGHQQEGKEELSHGNGGLILLKEGEDMHFGIIRQRRETFKSNKMARTDLF